MTPFLSQVFLFGVFYNCVCYGFLYCQKVAGFDRPVPKSVQPNLTILNQFNLLVNIWVLTYFAKTHQHDSLWVGTTKILVGTLVSSVWFYASHYALHNNFLYKHIHNIHHRWIWCDPRATLYSHPIENVVCNLMSLLFPMWWLCMSPTTSLIWCGGVSINALLSHSGPIFNMHSPHDDHHIHRKVNYGVGTYLDDLLGTKFFIETY